MEELLHTIAVQINSERPDFRLFWIFLWGEDHRFDSDGDSYNPASRDWTELYMSSREIGNQTFEILKIKDEPLVFEVSSANHCLLNRVTFFLKRETNGITEETDETLVQNMGEDFDLEEALKRADESVWRTSSLDNPYPNITS